MAFFLRPPLHSARQGASLYQDKPRGSRTEVEEALFKLGLGNANLWISRSARSEEQQEVSLP